MNMDLPEPTTAPLEVTSSRSRFRHKKFWIFGGTALFLILLLTGGYLWYQSMLTPASTKSQIYSFKVNSGDTAASVGQRLADQELIKSSVAFTIYMRLHNGTLLVGAYHVDPSWDTPKIANHLMSGKQDSYDITFYPGATLKSGVTTPEEKRTDVTTVLQRAGFSDDEISAALAKQYQSPLFAGKPSGASLEGYVYGETYQIDTGTSAEAILQRTFDTFWQVLSKDNLAERMQQHGLNLYEAITLASIIERESDNAVDQKQIAQIFYLRLATGMPLGSDVTFIYPAEQQGLVSSPSLDSPYNTRIHTGLPPGPIATPGLSALQAVADPSPGDYVYFLAGDDGQIHYGKTDAEHERNITLYCTKLCN